MTIWIAIILGLIQGLTEFLPVSSSGHLTFAELVFGFSSGSVLYNIILHVATLISLVIVMRKQIWWLITHPLDKYVRMLLTSSIITAVVGICIDKLIGAEGNLIFLAAGFALTAALLIVVQIITKRKSYNPLAPITYKQAIVVGIAQGIAVLPGLSRSGTTLATGIISHSGSKPSADFSFLLSIPIIIGGTIYEIYKGAKYGFGFNQADIMPMCIGFVVAFISSLLTLKIMLKLVNKNKWLYFSIYLIIFAIFIIIFGINKGFI